MPEYLEDSGRPTRKERHRAHGDELSDIERWDLVTLIGKHGGWWLDRRCPRCGEYRCQPRVSAWGTLARVGMLDPIDLDPTAAVVHRAA